MTTSLETRIQVLTAERDEYQKAAVRTAVNCKAENDKLLAERDALMVANKDLSNWFDALKADHDKLMAAGKLTLEALDEHEGNYKLNDAGCDRQNAAITALKQAGVTA